MAGLHFVNDGNFDRIVAQTSDVVTPQLSVDSTTPHHFEFIQGRAVRTGNVVSIALAATGNVTLDGSVFLVITGLGSQFVPQIAGTVDIPMPVISNGTQLIGLAQVSSNADGTWKMTVTLANGNTLASGNGGFPATNITYVI